MTDAHGNSSMTDMNGIRDRIIALQRSASNLVQMDLNELSALLPPGTPRERLIEIRTKLVQLHLLQNGREGLPENDNANSSADGVTSRSSRYKTELCRPFEENGVCKYGARCQFAHGVAELRNLARHPKYKSQLCRTFHSNGLCPYGHRCHFIHNQDEVRSVVPSKPVNIQANSNFTNLNMNNLRRNEAYPEFAFNEWGRRASFSSFSNETFQRPITNSLMQSLLSRTAPVTEMPITTAISSVNGFKSLATGCSLGSAGDLSPPVSPIVYSPDDPFSSQASIRPGYFPPGVLSEGSDSNLNQMLAYAKFSGPIVGSYPQTSGRSSEFAENSHGRNASQAILSSLWWNGEGL